MLVDDGLLELNQPVCKYLPAFGKNGKESITVADVLNHKAGLQNAGTREFTEDPFIACDPSKVMEVMENAEPEEISGYHYLSFGFLLDGIVRGVLNGEMGLKEFVEARIASQLKYKREFGIGVMEDECDDTRTATLVLQRNQLQGLAPKDSEKVSDIGGSGTGNEADGLGGDEEMKSAPSESDRAEVSSSAANTTVGTTTGSNGRDTISGEVSTTTSTGTRPSDVPSLLLNPTFFNNPRIKKSSLPAANGIFTARSLAEFYGSTMSSLFRRHDQGILYHLKVDERKNELGFVSNESMLQGGESKFNGGFMMYPTAEDQSGGITSSSQQRTCFGHSGLGGSIALCDISNTTGDVISLAITTNRLVFDSKPTRKILRSVYRNVLKIPVPLQFSEGMEEKKETDIKKRAEDLEHKKKIDIQVQ